MVDIVTIIATALSIEYIYVFVKIMGKTYSFVEISKKIQMVEDIKFMVDLANNKKKINNNTVYMGKLSKRVANLFIDIADYRLERHATQRESQHKQLLDSRKRRDARKARLDEKELFLVGYLRDKLSKHYISPAFLLQDIHKALVAKSPADKDVFDRLILNPDCELFDESDFIEIKKHLIYVKVPDRLTGLDFNSIMLDEPVYAVESILFLQFKAMKLYKVDQTALRHEHPMAPEQV